MSEQGGERSSRAAGIMAAAMAAGYLVVSAGPAYAAHLRVAPDAPVWMQLGAEALLWLHIGGGAVGMLSGVAAVVSNKGGRVHRVAGTVFLVAMLIAYGVATCVAPFMHQEQRTNTTGGAMALYLLLSGWWTMKKSTPKPGVAEVAGLVVALTGVAAGATFIWMGSQDPSGTVDGAPPQAFYGFALFGAIAAAGELHVLMRGKIMGLSRLARHLWRMCLSWFLAAGSFFLGQQQFLPDWFRHSPAPGLLALTPLALMVFFLVWIRVRRQRFGAPKTRPTPSTG